MRVSAHDVNATILRLLGLDHESLTYFYQGRDQRLTDVHGENSLQRNSSTLDFGFRWTQLPSPNKVVAQAGSEEPTISRIL